MEFPSLIIWTSPFPLLDDCWLLFFVRHKNIFNQVSNQVRHARIQEFLRGGGGGGHDSSDNDFSFLFIL